MKTKAWCEDDTEEPWSISFGWDAGEDFFDRDRPPVIFDHLGRPMQRPQQKRLRCGFWPAHLKET